MQYAVVDLETTGLYPGGHDRIVELAVVTLGPDLTISSEFTSLLNPDRDLGPSWLHGIRAADVLDAPTFRELAGAVSSQLQDAVVVGHNVTFDLRFLQSEFARLGAAAQQPPYFDTMSVSLRLGAPSRQLEEACDLFGIPCPDCHSALEDAKATAGLFSRCVQHLGRDEVERLIRWPAENGATWPRVEGHGAPLPRADAAARNHASLPFLATLVRDLPVAEADSSDWQEYYAVLDRALEDRRISPEEEGALREAAFDAGLGASDVKAANEAYLRTVVATAMHDGFLSESERRDLDEVARLLALQPILPELLSSSEAIASGQPNEQTASESDLSGKTVCFTGAMCASIDGERATRERATEIAQAHRMTVVKGVTKKLDMLVLADPDSMSGKARKARKYGTRLVAEPVFWSMVGISTDG